MQIAITNRGSNQIQPEIIKQMNNAQRSIWIAVAWFTDREIYNVLIEKLKKGVKIRLIALYDDINQEKGIDFDTLSKNGAEVYLTQDGNLLMHHKYCIIDSQTVIMGSYNYTKAAQSQRESVIVSKHENQIVTEFEAEFNDILKEYFNKTSNDCPLTMEWWDGLLKYGNLNKYDLKEYNWQDIFMVHLVFEEKKPDLSRHTFINGFLTHSISCFDIYHWHVKKTVYSKNLPKITQEKLNAIYQITTLYLCMSGLDTLEPLRELRNLQILDCKRNQISSLEPLRELKNLQKLDCCENQIRSLEGLQDCENLQILDCGLTQINNLKPLQKLKNLQKLRCLSSQINSLEGLQGCTNMQELQCCNNQINSLTPLREFKKLQKLECWSNKISNIEPLRELKSLELLNCSDNQISSLETLRELKNLYELKCYNNQISSLEGLQGCENLKDLFCYHNKISSLEPLRELNSLKFLACSHNQIKNLEPLRELKNLQTLNFSSNQIRSLEKEQFKKEHPNCDVRNEY